MNFNRNHSKNILDAAVDAVRSSEPNREDMEDRAARVWARVTTAFENEQSASATARSLKQREATEPRPFGTCDDYRALIPDYLAGRLTPARALLFTDHTHECGACLNALNMARSGGPRPRPVRVGWHLNKTAAAVAIAAMLVAGVALERTGYLNFLLPVMQVNAMARTIDGKLYRIGGLNMNPVMAGDAVKAGDPIRTAAGSRAIIELADGTRIEMRERSQLSLAGAHDGIRINLERGSVIVEAAKQRNGHLYVATEDCTVSVVGTVFAVSSGVKGSRVSVIQGEVHVTQNGSTEKALHPGQQLTTSPSLTNVSIEDEISWSRNLDTHLALLRALADVNDFLRDRVPGPELRFTSKLLPMAPANTVVYGAFPNVSTVVGQAYDLFKQKISQDSLLQAWWAERNQRRSATDPTLEEMIEHVRNLGGTLGEEVAIIVTGTSAGPGDAIVLANVVNPSGALTEINAMAAQSSQTNPIQVLTDPAQFANFTGTERGPIAYIDGSVLVLSTSPKAIYDVLTAQQSGSPFAGRPFYSSIAQAYATGAGIVFAADFATLFSAAQRSDAARAIGLASIDRLVFEQKQVAGKTTTKAQLGFNGERTGVAAWLAAPAPMGALEFVSPQAYGLASAVTKDGAAMLDEILNFAGESSSLAADIEKFQSDTGVDIRLDLAQPLGGEFLLAVEPPLFPTPSWKAVAEVYDSARLQNAFERLVGEINRRAAADGKPGVTLTSEAVNGQVYYRLVRTDGVGPEIDYTYALGYMIAAPSRGLVSQALQYQQSRSSISSTTKFRSMMPADGAENCSAVLYQNLTEAASSIASYVPTAVSNVTPQQLQTLKQTVELTPATLVCASGEPNRIVMGYQGDLAFNVLMLGGIRNVMRTMHR